MTAIHAQTERKRQDRSARFAEKHRCWARAWQVRGPSRPVPAACATEGAARGEKCLSSRQTQAILASAGRPLGECRLRADTNPGRIDWRTVQFRKGHQADGWAKATELVQELPGLSSVGSHPDARVRTQALVSTIPQYMALQRVGFAAAVYDEAGRRVLGPDGFPDQVQKRHRASTWTELGPHGVLFIFHRVVLEREPRLLCLGLDAECLHALLPETSRLTRSEFAVLAGVIDGRTVRAIAEADGVSYSTRRRQIETALDKLDVHSQTQALRLVYVAVVDRLLEALGATETARAGIETLAGLHGGHARVHWIHLAGSSPLRIIEFGDPRGRPVLLFHPMLFPCGQAPVSIPEMRHAGMRVIVPLRPGYFDAPVWSRRLSTDEILATWADRVDALLGFLNLDRVDVASIAIAAPWATEFARRYPERLRSMIFLSAPQPGMEIHGRRTATFIHSIADMVSRAPLLAEPMARLHSLAIRDVGTAHAAFRKTYRNSPHDLAEIECLAKESANLETVVSTLRESPKGIAADLRGWSCPWENCLAGLDVPIHFFHGEGDPLCQVSSIERLVRKLPQARTHVEAGQGHLMYVRGLPGALARSVGP